ncbi:L,D-transpeptidase [Brucella sp. 22210]|uniref:L,D-transpeptidase n=1 Tax=Brucella sp. 22210 TaxID=3453892 RepID=UPI003F87026A
MSHFAPLSKFTLSIVVISGVLVSSGKAATLFLEPEIVRQSFEQHRRHSLPFSTIKRPINGPLLRVKDIRPSASVGAAAPIEAELDQMTTGSINRTQPAGQEFSSTYVPTADDMAPAIEMPRGVGSKEQIAAYQIMLDRAGASPGAIDGRSGSNVDKAAAAFGEITGRFINPADPTAVQAELENTGGPAFKDYLITNEDVGRQFVAEIPADYALKAQLPAMAYTSVTEMLGERFQIDEGFLKEINPGVNFNQPGSVIKVPNLGKAKRTPIAHIVADKGRKQVRGYGADGKLKVAYPSTIGSSDTPSPSGTVQVKRIAINPNYTYNPRINFKQGSNEGVLTIPPGPNGPVGTVWIALSKPTYGIHGTPDPSRIGKTSSHGCVRLTNWDAEELAKIVKPGVMVVFTE